MAGWIYAAVAAATCAGFVYLAIRLMRAPTNIDMRKAARRLFTYSLSYLFVLFLGLLADSFVARLGAFWS